MKALFDIINKIGINYVVVMLQLLLISVLTIISILIYTKKPKIFTFFLILYSISIFFQNTIQILDMLHIFAAGEITFKEIPIITTISSVLPVTLLIITLLLYDNNK